MRNSEGYYDPTAGIALRNVERKERMMQEFKRGYIFYVEKSMAVNTASSGQANGRPALIVSNDRFNMTSDILEVVYLTYNPRNDLPTHVTIRGTNSESVAICEQVTSVHKDRFGGYIMSATDDEMARIDMALLISLDLSLGNPQEAPKAQQAEKKEPPKPSHQQSAPPVSGRDWETEYMAEKKKYEEELAVLKSELIQARSEADIYKGLYTDMTDRAMGRAVNA